MAGIGGTPGKRKRIDGDKVEALAAIGASQKEIAVVLKCSPQTLDRRFHDRMELGWERMKVSLKRAQFDTAVNKRNPTMQIWLGKQYLAQRDDPGGKQVEKSDQLQGLFDALMAGEAKRKAAPGSEAPKADGEAKKEDGAA